ncbi:MAG: cytochrome c3 family protein [bacterium]|nr:cytochrome c3 family protein [bacterium]
MTWTVSEKITTVLIAFAISLVPGRVFAGAEFRILAPAEESFVGMEEVLIIGKVDGFSEAKMVEITDNGKTLGFAPLQKNSFVFRWKLGEGRHEVVLTAPDIDRKAIKVFVGKQKGYRYHIETGEGTCGECHAGAAKHDYAVPPMQEEICSKCHDAKGTKEFVHGPVAAASCSPCHDPHGSRFAGFLVATGKDLCLVCHSQNLSKKHIEERQNADCVKCHDPHSSDKNYHLR